ncbi:RHS repeat-associated core domain-containing protein [Parasediminibacterium paludis]|uniref:RHS repeat-associated core domain-containing protein n=1 Tax=Parasediminibacterium paludis TaxID=908966 RepID=A0ABV8PQW5_9BACT
MAMPSRKYMQTNTAYRYGFNGKEKDKDIYCEGNAYDFGERIEDPRLGRWLSLDPLMKNYPSLSPYNGFGNNPIIMKDPDGRDIVYFNRQGQEVLRIQSSTRFETYVEVNKKNNAVHNVSPFNFSASAGTTTTSRPIPFVNEFQKVPMPDIITEKLTTNKDKDGNWIIEKGLSAKKYQQYDYQIAASTFLFNESKNDGSQQFVTDGGVKIPTAITSKVSNVSPTNVKELMMQETHYGTDALMNGKDDIMQVNNGVSNFQDYKPYKANYGLSKGTVPRPLLSITAGLKDLLTKGFKGGVTYDSMTGTQTFTFQGWLQAGKNYNGNGVPNYLESLQHMESTKRAPTANDY